MDAIKTYYALTKPGIVYGNAMTAAAGFFLASKWHVDAVLLTATLIGISLVIASACVYNNYIDRGIDQKMARTSKRALAAGKVTGRNALLFATALGALGFLLLAAFANWLTVAMGAIGLVFYVVVYGISKRRSIHGTLIGSISGAVPPVAGYVAVTNKIDLAAVLLFVILVFWQMPHFYAIAIYRLKDYTAAGLPMLPVKVGIAKTKIQIFLYAVGFLVCAALLTVLGYTGNLYLFGMLLIGGTWVWLCIKGFRAKNNTAWARQVFRFSLVVLLALSLGMAVNPRV